MKTYTTTEGDTWDLIAYRELGSERYTALLMEANTEHIHTVIFSAGIKLTIPEISTPLPESLPPWKR